MIGKIVENKAETGYYEQGQKIIRVLLTLVTSLGIVMIPRMASTFASGDKEKIRKECYSKRDEFRRRRNFN